MVGEEHGCNLSHLRVRSDEIVFVWPLCCGCFLCRSPIAISGRKSILSFGRCC